MISVRISRELREDLRKHGIKVSEVVRRALEEEVRRRKLKSLHEAAVKLGLSLLRYLMRKLLSIEELRSAEEVDEAMKYAVEQRLTFYGASYLQKAKNKNCMLVTEDKELLKNLKMSASKQ